MIFKNKKLINMTLIEMIETHLSSHNTLIAKNYLELKVMLKHINNFT